MLGYLPFFAGAFLLLRLKRDSMFAQFHMRQALVLFLLGFAVHVILLILLVAVPVGTTAYILVMFVIWAAYLVLMVGGMVKSLRGDRFRMPFVADVALWMKL